MTAPTIRRADELADMLSDQEKAAKLVQDGTLKNVVEEYAREFVKNDADAKQHVKEQVQAEFAAMLRDNGYEGVDRPDMRSAAQASLTSRRGAHYCDEAIGAGMDDKFKFKNGADFLRTVWHGNRTEDAAVTRNKILNEYSSEIGPDGGFLVPESMRSQLMESAMEASLSRPRSLVLPMPTKTLSLPSIDSTSNVSSVFGGLVAYWVEEGGTVPETNVKFGVTKLEAKLLMGKSLVPNTLLQDSALAMDALIRRTWGKAIAWFEDADGFVDGNGVGRPLGWNHADNGSIINVTKETNQPAATITWENIVKMYSRQMPSSLGTAVWFANIDTLPELSTMGLVVGTGGGPVWQTNGVVGPPMTLMGRPVIWSEHMETLGTAGDIAFADLSYYGIGDRMAMSIATSEHTNFDEFKTNFRIIERADGRPLMKQAITPRKSAKTLSPFVRLATRA